MMKKTKKCLSVFLSLLMLLTSVTVAFTGLTVVTNAASQDYKAADTSIADVELYVPEQIYAAPDYMSWKNTVRTPFQQFVNTNSDGTITQGAAADSVGHFYFNYANAVNPVLNVKAYVNLTDSAALTGGNIIINGTTYAASSDIAISNNESFDFTGNTPNLTKQTDGYYLVWKVSFQDSTDNKQKVAVAVSYVYKPFVIPVSASARGIAGGASKHTVAIEAAGFMTGFHYIDSVDRMTGSRRSNGSEESQQNQTLLYSRTQRGSDKRSGASLFITDKAIYNNSSLFSNTNPRSIDSNTHLQSITDSTSYSAAYNDVLSPLPLAQRLAAYQYVGVPAAYNSEATPGTSNPSFDIPNNKNWGYRHDAPGGQPNYQFVDPHTGTYPINSEYQSKKDGGAFGADYGVMQVTGPGAGVIAIDTSRYTKLEQIPNLNIGMVVVSDENTNSGGLWYIADASLPVTGGQYADRSQANTNGDSEVTFTNGTSNHNPLNTDCSSDSLSHAHDLYNTYTEIIAGQAASFSLDQSYDTNEGFRYAGKWYRTRGLTPAASPSTKVNYQFRTYFAGRYSDSNYGISSTTIQLQAYQVNKANLRAQVKRATNAMARIGVNELATSNVLGSCYFLGDNDDGWGAFATAYLDAVKLLTKLNLSSTEAGQVNTAYTALKNALDNLATRTTVSRSQPQGSVTVPDLYVKVGTDGYGTIDITPYMADSVVHPNTGYEFAGYSTVPNDPNPQSQTLRVGYNEKIYPVFQPIDITVALDADNGGLYNPGQTSFTVKYNQTPSPIANLPENEGASFAGYYTQKNGQGTPIFDAQGSYVGGNWTDLGPTTLYAKWDKMKCQVQYVGVDDGLVYWTTTVDYGDDAPAYAGRVKSPTDMYHYTVGSLTVVGNQSGVLTVTQQKTTVKINWKRTSHTYVDTIIKPATCGSEGKTLRQCSDPNCMYTMEVTVPPNGQHVWPANPTKENVHTEADCENFKGWTDVWYCTKCGEQLKAEDHVEEPALGHNFDENDVDCRVASDAYLKHEASCVSPAEYYVSCSRCHVSSKGTKDEKTFEFGDKVDHHFVKVFCDNTFNDAGFEAYLCTVCGYAYTSNGLKMQVLHGKTEITKYDGNGEKIYLPEHINGYPIVKIDPDVFLNYQDIEHVFYSGTEAQWGTLAKPSQIDFTHGNESLFLGKMHFAGGSGSISEDAFKNCPYCGKCHPTTFIGQLTQFFHVILNFFRKIGSALTHHK